MLKEIPVEIADLLLDPNNPRFITALGTTAQVPDDQIEAKQDSVLKRFSRTSKAEDPEFDVTNIKDLYDSMLRIGFVGIDRIVVRRLKNSDKYLVLEGNRRVATIKTILKDHAAGLINPDRLKDVKAHLNSFNKLRVMQLNTEGLSDEQLAHHVSILLGLRHHGSLLPWKALPRAFNIYSEYMSEDPPLETFIDDPGKINAVASRLCIKPPQVRDALRTYIAYLQLCSLFPEIQEDHFTLIEAGVKDPRLRAGYFSYVDERTFQLTEESLLKFNNVCQFATRDSKNTELTTNGKKKILPTPKDFAVLGKLFDKVQSANHPALKAFASAALKRAENEDDIETTPDQALSEVIAFENRTKWAEAISKLLVLQAEKLDLSLYKGEGPDRGQKDELKVTMEPLRNVIWPAR